MTTPSQNVHFEGANSGLQVAWNYGNIYFSKDGEEVSCPSPCSTAPTIEDEDFIGRDAVLHDIEGRLTWTADSHKRVALVGQGGVGKTRIAIEYAARLRQNHTEMFVIWVHAGSEEEFRNSFTTFANKASIPGRKDPKVDILDTVVRWLQANGPWLMVVDNNDDEQLLFTQRKTTAASDEANVQNALANFVPRAAHGRVLVTTRDSRAGLKLCGYQPNINVERMSLSEAKSLFLKRVSEALLGEEDLEPLLELLENLPLAINQATAYIRQQGIPVATYRQLLNDSEEQVELLAKDLDDGRPARSVIKTWVVSFDLIKERSPKAAELLSLMSFLHYEAIPKLLLDTSTGMKVEFIDAIGTLKAFCFIMADSADENFGMHRLVQVATRAWVQRSKTQEMYQIQALKALSHRFPTGKETEPPPISCQQLYLHANTVLEYQYREAADQICKSHLLHYTALYASDQGYFSTAEKWMLEAVAIRKETPMVDEVSKLYSMHNLAMAQFDMGRFHEAHKTETEVVQSFENLTKKADKEDAADRTLDLLEAMSQLANMCMATGAWSEAELLALRSVAICERQQLKPLNPKITLASIYKDTGKYELAQNLAEEVVQQAKGAFGPEDPRTLSYMRILTLVYRRRGRLDQAVTLGDQLVHTMEKQQGKEHPDTVDCMTDLMLICEDRGEFERAQELGEWVVYHAQVSQVFGPNHPSTLSTLSNLASVYEKLGKLETAENVGQTVVEASKSIMGETHRNTLLSMGNLASIYRSRGKLDQAAELGRQVLKARNATLREDHPDILIGVLNLALTYSKQGCFEEIRNILFHPPPPEGGRWSLMIDSWRSLLMIVLAICSTLLLVFFYISHAYWT